jgi:hypothetical protein
MDMQSSLLETAESHTHSARRVSGVIARDAVWLGVAPGIRTGEDALGTNRIFGSFHGPRLLELCNAAGN